MCGIVGYFGKGDVLKELEKRLLCLEHRGYDSAGAIVFGGGGNFILEKAAGKGNLEKVFANMRRSFPNIDPVLGIAHTRWASRGDVCKKNAHPHSDPDGIVYVVHNGTIIDDDSLRRHCGPLTSETDTEILAHLIAGEFKKIRDKSGNLVGMLEKATLAAVRKYRIIGKNAFVVVSPLEKTIVGVCMGQALDVGIGDGFTIVASGEESCFGAKKIFHLDNGEVIVVGENAVRFIDFNGKTVEKESYPPYFFPEDVKERGKSGRMLSEILSQPEVLKRVFDYYSRGFYPYLRERKKDEYVSSIPNELVLSGCGSSFFAALLAAKNFEDSCSILTRTEYASEFPDWSRGYPDVERGFNPAFFLISQSGVTRDTLDVLDRIPAESFTIALCNRSGSELTRRASLFLPMVAGVEDSVAATKSFTATLFVSRLVGLWWAYRRKRIKRGAYLKELDALIRFPEIAGRTTALSEDISSVARKFMGYDYIFLGRGYSYPVALEGALKMKEVSGKLSDSMPAGEVKHGPLAIVDKRTLVVVVVPEDEVSRQTLLNMDEVRARKGRIVAITTPGNALLTREKEHLKGIERIIIVPKTESPLLQAILTVIPLQLLAYWTAIHKGLNPDRPRNLAKSVTVP